MALTDPYFRSFDQNAPDYYRFKEWEREFDASVQSGKLPNLTLLRLAHDHFGSFGTAEDGINTPALQFADNDYAIGMVMEKLSKSPFAANTLVFVVEDDAQDGPDHVDAHRSIAYVVGPYVKHNAVVSERYTTVSLVHTIEALLGLKSSSIYAAASAPMSEVFDPGQSAWSYAAQVPAILRTTKLPLPASTAENTSPAPSLARDTHDAKYWQRRLGDMDYDVEDKLDVGRFNRELWKGMMSGLPYPAARSGQDLREKPAGTCWRVRRPGTEPRLRESGYRYSRRRGKRILSAASYRRGSVTGTPPELTLGSNTEGFSDQLQDAATSQHQRVSCHVDPDGVSRFHDRTCGGKDHQVPRSPDRGETDALKPVCCRSDPAESRCQDAFAGRRGYDAARQSIPRRG